MRPPYSLFDSRTFHFLGLGHRDGDHMNHVFQIRIPVKYVKWLADSHS